MAKLPCGFSLIGIFREWRACLLYHLQIRNLAANTRRLSKTKSGTYSRGSFFRLRIVVLIRFRF